MYSSQSRKQLLHFTTNITKYRLQRLQQIPLSDRRAKLENIISHMQTHTASAPHNPVTLTFDILTLPIPHPVTSPPKNNPTNQPTSPPITLQNVIGLTSVLNRGRFYRYSAKRGLAIACRLSLCL